MKYQQRGRTEGRVVDLIIPLNKPVGPTSHDIVNQVRKITGVRKVGHAGTLDPLASGVLVVGIGLATRRLNQVAKTEKEYQAVIRLGQKSTTDDSEGQLTSDWGGQPPALGTVIQVLKRWVGKIEQIPPQFSAIKVKGKSAYHYARQGQKLQLKPRQVTIKQINLITYQWPKLEVQVTCSSGVYIRSLARDIGEGLDTGGYLQALHRTRVGIYQVDKAMDLKQFKDYWQSQLQTGGAAETEPEP